MRNGGTSLSCHPGVSLSNGKTSEKHIEVPKVVVENTEEPTGFASSVFKVLSMQRFYTKSVRKSRETWLQKYAYHRANEEREWRRPLMRKSPSPSPQPESPASDQPGTSNMNDEHDSIDESADFQRSCCMSLVLEPSGDFYFCWLLIVSLGVLYNYWAIILFIAYPSIYTDNIKTCFGIDYAFDSIFVLDILIQFRMGYLQDGIMERRSKTLAAHYVRSWGFVLDILSVIPFDLLYLVVGLYPILRVNRFLKVHRYFLFCDRGEIFSGRPKLFNLFKLIQYLFLIIHWVACLYFILSRFEGFGQDKWIHPKLEGQLAAVSMQYLYSLYRSSVSMTTVGTVTSPNTLLTMIFVIVTYLCVVLIFATIVGNAGDMIVDMRKARELYLRKLNGMKAYIEAHQLSAHLKKRVIQWFDYLWTQKRDMDEEQLFAQLNDNFKAEIAIHVNLETLIKVEMFHDCDPGFLHDLVLKLKPSISSPGDFICRQGERGREMYIVNKGQVEVLDEMETILATLKAGSHFGEISLLNMKGIGDRRTASVRSVGFTDLFRLSKDDLDEVLLFYPEEKSHMERIATKTYEKQQRERRREVTKKNEHEGSSVNDPRKWFSADTETLRRRLSWVEAVNNLRRFASRIRKKQHPNDQSTKEILQEFSRKAQQQRSNEESRRIIEDFVAEIRACEDEKAAKNEFDYPAILSSSSSECLTSEQLCERLRKFRNMTKRSSFTTLDKGDTLDSAAQTYGRPLRPRSFTTGPVLRHEQTVLNFQTLNKTSSKSLVRLGSFRGKGELKPMLGKTLTTEPGREKVLQMFTRKASKPKNLKALNFSSSFVVSKEDSLESLRFKDIVRSTMERKRKWFEGDELADTSEKNKKISEDDAQRKNSKGKHSLKPTFSITPEKSAEADGLKRQITLPAIIIEKEADGESKNETSGMEEPAKKRDQRTENETGSGKSEIKAEPVNDSNINMDCTCNRPSTLSNSDQRIENETESGTSEIKAEPVNNSNINMDYTCNRPSTLSNSDQRIENETGSGTSEIKAVPVNDSNINMDCTCNRPSTLSNSSDNSNTGQHDNKNDSSNKSSSRSNSNRSHNTTLLSSKGKSDNNNGSSSNDNSNSSDSNNKRNCNKSSSSNNNNQPKGTTFSSGELSKNIEKERQKQLKDDKKIQQSGSKQQETKTSRAKDSESTKQTTVTLLHPVAQCACSEEDTSRKTPQAPEHTDKKKPAVTDTKKESNREASNVKEPMKTDKEKQKSMEETCC